MPTPHFDIRLPSDLKDWLGRYAEKRGTTQTQVVCELARALVEGRASFEKPERKTARLRVRMDEGTKADLDRFARYRESNAGEVLREALDALRDGRLDVASSFTPDPFPADEE